MPNSQSARLHRRRNADQLIDGDAVYLRHPGRIDGFSDGQVMQLALLAAAVIESHSLALYALDELVRRSLVPADLPGRYADALPPALLVRDERGEAAQSDPAPAPSPAAAAPAPAAKTRVPPTKPAASRAKPGPASPKATPAKKPTLRSSGA